MQNNIYENNRDPDTPRKGSKEYRIKVSCRHQGINRLKWKDFLTNQKYCNLWTEKFRQKIRNKYHNKCFLCGKTKEQNKRNLDVHHVNYNKNCLCGSSCEFVALCRSCHMKTNGNRQYWENLIMGYLYPNRYFIIEI